LTWECSRLEYQLDLPVPRPSRSTTRAILAALIALICLAGLAASRVGAAAAATATAAHSGLLWSGDFSTRNLSQWHYVQACRRSVRVVPSPLSAGTFAARITVGNGDTHDSCRKLQPGPSPSAFLISPPIFRAGNERYISFSTLFPAGFPRITNWFQIAELYGPPYGGSPPIGIYVSGRSLVLGRDVTHHYDTPWRSRIRQGSWEHLVLEVKFSADPRIGFVKLWLNGIPQTFAGGRRRLAMGTLIPGINWTGRRGADSLDIGQYRAAQPALGTVTVYEGQVRVGTGYAAVR
jgi:Polysaccharide lyase